jgi:hypothetical protein
MQHTRRNLAEGEVGSRALALDRPVKEGRVEAVGFANGCPSSLALVQQKAWHSEEWVRGRVKDCVLLLPRGLVCDDGTVS